MTPKIHHKRKSGLKASVSSFTDILDFSHLREQKLEVEETACAGHELVKEGPLIVGKETGRYTQERGCCIHKVNLFLDHGHIDRAWLDCKTASTGVTVGQTPGDPRYIASQNMSRGSDATALVTSTNGARHSEEANELR